MKRIKVEIAGRQRKRHRKQAVNSYLKGLTEIITNSDQSIENLEALGETSGEINIYFDQDTNQFSVVDYAEGMSRDTMIKIFSRTGAKHDTHRSGGRSLFGKGLSDTLFSPIMARGEVHSIKDGKYSWIGFIRDKDGEEYIEPHPEQEVDATDEVRKKIHIPTGNGTCVVFKLAGKTTHRPQTVVNELKNFYMLRFINMNRSRHVRLHIKGRGDDYAVPIRFVEPDDKEQVGETLETEYDFLSDYPKIKITGTMFRTNKRLKQGEVGLEKRTGGLLIYDENKNVIDMQLFSYNDDPNARQYFGYLQLYGAYEIIRDYLEKEDEAIITDTRDGFDGRSQFYRGLKKIVDPWIRKIVSTDEKNRNVHRALSAKTLENQKKAFAQLNEIYQKINDDVPSLDERPGPEKGMVEPIEFAAKKVNLKVNKKYKLSLRVDTNRVELGSVIKLAKSFPEESYEPAEVEVKKPESGSIFSQQITLHSEKANVDGVVKATFQDNSASVYVNVTVEELHMPQNGLEFYPKRYVVPPGAKKSLFLFVDMRKVGINEVIQFNTEDEGIALQTSSIIVRHSVKSIGDVARIEVPIIALNDGEICKVQAKTSGYSSEALIEIREHEEKGRTADIFNDWEYSPRDTNWQIWPSLSAKKMIINSNHPINRAILGKTQEEAEEKFEKFPHCQLFIGDLILTNFLEFAYSRAYNNGLKQDPNANNFIREKKHEVGLKILGLFVNFNEMARLEGMEMLWK